MSRPKVMGRGKASYRLFIVLLAVSVAILWVAPPIVAFADTFTTMNKLTVETVAAPGAPAGKKKVFEITYSPALEIISAKVDGRDLGSPTLYPYPVKINSSNYILKLDERGPFLMTGGDSCLCIPRPTGIQCYGSPCP
jgi:hypothetical protein